MSRIVEIVSGMFMLIGIYLFLSNWTATTRIISSISSATTSSVKVLQGRG